jgi:hypothetical protein
MKNTQKSITISITDALFTSSWTWVLREPVDDLWALYVIISYSRMSSYCRIKKVKGFLSFLLHTLFYLMHGRWNHLLSSGFCFPSLILMYWGAEIDSLINCQLEKIKYHEYIQVFVWHYRSSSYLAAVPFHNIGHDAKRDIQLVSNTDQSDPLFFSDINVFCFKNVLMFLL